MFIPRLAGLVFIAFAGALTADSADTAINEIIFDGTSLTGDGWTGPGLDFPNQLINRLGGGWDHWNFAVGGQTGVQMIADFATQVAPRFIAGAHQAVVFEMGTNDLGVEEVTPEEAERRYDTYFDLCVAAGWAPNVIFIRPLSPRFQIPEEIRTEVNNYLVQKYPHNCVDPASDPRIYGAGAMVNRKYYADSVHPNALGAALEADGIRKKMAMEGFLPVILSLIGPGHGSLIGVVGQRYRIEVASALDATAWDAVAEVTLTETEQQWIDENSGDTQRFYRAVFIQ